MLNFIFLSRVWVLLLFTKIQYGRREGIKSRFSTSYVWKELRNKNENIIEARDKKYYVLVGTTKISEVERAEQNFSRKIFEAFTNFWKFDFLISAPSLYIT